MQLLPRLSSQSLVQRRLANEILKLNPGMGEAAATMAESLADSGLSPSAATMLIQAVYAPNDPVGRGQTTRANFFIAAVRRRYDYKLAKIQKDIHSWRTFIADMDEMNELRDTLRGEDLSVTFEEAFLLWEVGLDADAVLNIIQTECEGIRLATVALKHVVKAAQLVKSGMFMEMETAIKEMRHGYEYEVRPEDYRKD